MKKGAKIKTKRSTKNIAYQFIVEKHYVDTSHDDPNPGLTTKHHRSIFHKPHKKAKDALESIETLIKQKLENGWKKANWMIAKNDDVWHLYKGNMEIFFFVHITPSYFDIQHIEKRREEAFSIY